MSLRSDVRHALRLRLERPRFAALVILTLALGIGANAAIFSVVNAVVLSALPLRDARQLVVLQEHLDKTGDTTVSYLNFLDWRRMNASFEDMACCRPVAGVLGLVALGATWWPARRAASTDPIATLRCE